MMEILNGKSMDLTEYNLNKLKELFPEVFEEGNIDFDKLRLILGDEVEDKEERYEFTWHGKNNAIRIAQTPSTGTLISDKESSKNWDDTENLYIEGDNLEVLKLLQKSYFGKVKMIYIDPPYNTGNDFVYHDNFKDNIANYKEITNQTTRANPETNGRYHTDWINMMYPRLKLARNLLKDDGSIFISIDDNELFNLKKVCDEIFGEHNFINLINCKTKIAGVSGSHLGKSLQNNVEYILCYAKDMDFFKIKKSPLKKRELIKYIDNMKVQNSSWKYTSVLKNIDEGIYVKSILDGDGNEIKVYKHDKYTICSIGRLARENYNNDIKSTYYENIDNIFRTTNAQSSIRSRVLDDCKDIDNSLISIEYIPNKGKYANQKIRLYYKDKSRNLIAWLKDVVTIEDNTIYKIDNKGNLWDDLQYNNLTKEGNIKFSNGKKPIQMIKELINMVCDEESIILDFFSGSATTAHAAMECNIENNTNCKYILVQLPERIRQNSDEYKAGYKNICEIGKERIRRAGDKILSENKGKEGIENLDIGFKVFKLDSSNLKSWDSSMDNLEQNLLDMESNLKKDRTNEDLLYEILLKSGIELTAKIEEIKVGYNTLYNIGQGALLACLDDRITQDVIDEIPKHRSPFMDTKVIFKEAGFMSDAAKINAVQNLKQFKIEDVRSV